jgi:hypothetical protein
MIEPHGMHAIPLHARPFVIALLTVLVVCAVGTFNLWPFSSWELFSRLRTDRQTGWSAVAVDRAGRDRAYPINSQPHGLRGFQFVIARFPERPAAERNAICAAWLAGARELFGPDTQLVRIYHLEWRLSDRRGERAAPPHSELAWTCSAKGARETS